MRGAAQVKGGGEREDSNKNFRKSMVKNLEVGRERKPP